MKNNGAFSHAMKLIRLDIQIGLKLKVSEKIKQKISSVADA